MTELDETMRTRLRQLAAHAAPTLSEPARARVRQHVLAQAERRAQLAGAGFFALAAAGLGLLLWAVPSWLSQTDAVPARSTERTPPAHGAPARHAAAGERQCSDDDLVPQAGREQVAGAQLELKRARILGDATGALLPSRLTSCALSLPLGSGQLFVHARELGGGSLDIDTALGTVSVRGTVFSVDARRPGRLRIAVAEGRVSLRRAGQLVADVSALHTLEVDAQGALQRAPLEAGERLRLLSRLGLLSRRDAPASPAVTGDAGARVVGVGPDASTSQAPVDRIWHEGAPLTPPGPELPSSVQPDGRPMKKPTLVNPGETP